MRTTTKRASSPKKSNFPSAAAMKVKRFGQATYTSMRSMKNGNDDKLIPITTKIDDLTMKDSSKPSFTQHGSAANIGQAPHTPVAENKPKVYKFFKSRQTTTPTVNINEMSVKSENKNPIKIIHDDYNNKRSNNNKQTKDKTSAYLSKASRTVDLPPIKTEAVSTRKPESDPVKTSPVIEVKIVKKSQILPARKSNVKNANVKPVVVQAPPKVVSLREPSGVRSSRRLAERRAEDLTTESTDSFPEDEMKPVEAVSSVSSSSTRGGRKPAKEETKIEIVPEVKEDKYEDNIVDHWSSSVPTNDLPQDNHKAIDSRSEIKPIIEPVVEPVAAIPEPVIASQPAIVKTETVLEAPKPPIKKKTFFNRKDRKAEFNTKSFFAVEKDEFDIEMEQQQQSQQSASSSNNADKRDAGSAIGFDDDDDDVDLLSKLKKVKKAHQCHDLGETAQFDQDIRYYLSGISEKNSNSIRCLSILGLAEKAMKPEFRMQLRAHDDMPRINKALADAANDPNLAICASALMFVYNQDRLKMDIDPNALSLMLTLLESKSEDDQKVEEKHRSKIVDLVEQLKKKGLAQYLKLNEVSAGKLAMETFLGLTSKRAGDWFKEELRKMNGIDFILDTVMKYANNSHDENDMFKIDRCMHVLENVTFNNLSNQRLVTEYKNRQFIQICISLMKTCKEEILIGLGEKKVFVSTLFSLLRVFTSLTTESAIGCQSIGSFNNIMDLLLEFLFTITAHIQADQRFDLSMIIFCLCINLVEYCRDIRDSIMNNEKNMNALRDYLFEKIHEADKVDKAADEMLESHENVQLTEAMQDNLLKQMISKSGTHMEHSLLAACVCLLFGCCIQENRTYTERLINSLPNRSFGPLIDMLKKLRDFAHLADIMTQKGKDRVEKVLSVFRRHNMEE